MILQALHELALQEGLAEDLDFQQVPVRFVITLGPGEPKLLDRQVLSPAEGKKKPKPHTPTLRVPRQEGRTSGDKAYFLVDKAEYALGLDLTGTQKPEKLFNRLRLFRDRVVAAREALPPTSRDAHALEAVLAFLNVPEAQRRLVMENHFGKDWSEALRKELASALFAFSIDPLGTQLVHLLPDIEAYWRRGRLQEERASATCLVTGEPCAPVALHPVVKGVPGGNTSGAALISFNASAFESYGLQSSANAPVSRTASEACGAALNRLLSQNPVNPDGEPLPKRNLRLSANTVALFWNVGGSDPDWLLKGFEADDPEAVRTQLEAPYAGKISPLKDPSRFYTLIVGGAQGRSMIRSHLRSTTTEVAHQMLRYLEQVSVEKPFGKGTGPYPLSLYLRALAPLGDLENLPPWLASELYLAAIHGTPFPHVVLEAAVRRNRVEGPGGRDTPEAQIRFAARCGLIRAFLIRQSTKEFPMSLNPERPETAYHLGALLALLDRCQTDAQGNVNATLVDRYYGSASATPTAVFPTLLRHNQHHLAKLRKEKPGMAVNHDKRLQEIMGRLGAFPRTLNLQEQGLFALGFHHQRQAFFTSTK